MSWIAEYDTQGREFPTCVHVTKTIGTMTHGATYVPIEDGRSVRADNAKLRELVSDFDKCLTEAARLAYIQGHMTIYDGTLLDSLHPRMRELGIEVTT